MDGGLGLPSSKLDARFFVYYLNSFEPLILQCKQQGIGSLAPPEETGYYFYQNDPNGMPLRLYDAQGEIAWSAHYTIFGQTDKLDETQVKQPLRLQGQYFDEESGLHYNRHRYYDPATGVFVSQDPIGLVGGLNVYQFAPNTLLWVDPLGLSWIDIAKGQGHSVPNGMSNPHGHHIVFKGQYNTKPAMRAELDRSITVLNKYGITDIENDKANLMIANNGEGVHTVENAKKVADSLELADKELEQEIKDGNITKNEADEKMKCKLQETGKNVFGGYK